VVLDGEMGKDSDEFTCSSFRCSSCNSNNKRSSVDGVMGEVDELEEASSFSILGCSGGVTPNLALNLVPGQAKPTVGYS